MGKHTGATKLVSDHNKTVGTAYEVSPRLEEAMKLRTDKWNLSSINP